jgi:hypothetical protein
MADGIYGAVIKAQDRRWHAAYVRAPEEIDDDMLWDSWDPEFSEPAERWTVLGPFTTAGEAEAYVPHAAVRAVDRRAWDDGGLWEALLARSATPDGPPPPAPVPRAPGRVDEAWERGPAASREDYLAEGLEPWEDDEIWLYSSREAAERAAREAVARDSYEPGPDGVADLWRVDLRGIDNEYRPELSSGGTDVIIRGGVPAGRLTLVATF